MRNVDFQLTIIDHQMLRARDWAYHVQCLIFMFIVWYVRTNSIQMKGFMQFEVKDVHIVFVYIFSLDFITIFILFSWIGYIYIYMVSDLILFLFNLAHSSNLHDLNLTTPENKPKKRNLF